ncbi:MAG: hypothetical protein JWN38_739 [Candidatus Saccharibacteria bacterium]|nr:hypothetical protein [Candidatus Saccharibacteria bacterium]
MQDDETPTINFNLDVSKVPVLFSGAYLISSDDNSMTINFAQPTIDGSQQNIVARVAMTLPQAKELLQTLNDHIEKFEI